MLDFYCLLQDAFLTMGFIICTPPIKYYLGNQVKKNEVRETCDTCGGQERGVQGFGREN
jgi:hypothetical protein